MCDLDGFKSGLEWSNIFRCWRLTFNDGVQLCAWPLVRSKDKNIPIDASEWNVCCFDQVQQKYLFIKQAIADDEQARTLINIDVIDVANFKEKKIRTKNPSRSFSFLPKDKNCRCKWPRLRQKLLRN